MHRMNHKRVPKRFKKLKVTEMSRVVKSERT